MFERACKPKDKRRANELEDDARLVKMQREFGLFVTEFPFVQDPFFFNLTRTHADNDVAQEVNCFQ